jgi:RecB family exonuclease
MTKREYVHQAFDRGMVCIFPTEAAAQAAAIDYVLYSERGALLSERAISFDTFRSLFLPRRKTHRPSNTLIRHLFVQSLIDQEIPLPSLINPAYPEASRRMIRPIARLLPTLLQIVSDSQLFDTLNQRRRDDIHLLYSLYLAFLDERELYEPEWELPVLPAQWDGSTTYCILYSDTIDRAQLLYEQLGSPPSIILSPTPSTVVTRLVVYPNHIQEIRAMIREIYRLLQEGMESSQIVIGCTAATVLVPVVEEEARRWGIPLSVREGRNPLQYPGGKFFTHLQRIYEERCSLESLKSLLLDPSIPFDEKQPIHRFLARAVRQSIFDGSLHGEDHYTQRLGDTSLVQWYTSLRNLIVGICEAKTPNALRRALNAFQQHLFIETQWKGRSGEEVYSYCLDTIAEVEQALEASRIESHDRLFSLLLSHLGSKRYVFQQQEAGVSVYAWPQVATIGAEHLFVIGLDQDGSRVLHRPLAFLDEEGEEYEIETTDAHLAAVSLKVGRVHLSCHLRRYDSENLPPARFLEEDRTDYHDASTLDSEDPFTIELARWRGETVKEDRALPTQQLWFDRALRTTLAPRRDDYTRYPVSQKLIPRLKAPWKGEQLLFLSATKIDRFSRCPYHWLAVYLLGIEEVEWEPQSVNHRLIGAVLHHAYQRFYSLIQTFNSTRRGEYQRMLFTLFDEALERFFGHRGPTVSIRSWIVAAHRQQMTQIIDQDARLFNRCASLGLEEELWLRHQDVVLNGRIDRIVDLDPPQGSRVGVVDFKKGEAPMTQLTREPKSYQLPLYQRLVEGARDLVCANASYYSIKEGRYRSLWESEDAQEALYASEALDQRIASLAAAVEEGRLAATPSQESCSGCPYRMLCRRRYATP